MMSTITTSPQDQTTGGGTYEDGTRVSLSYTGLLFAYWIGPDQKTYYENPLSVIVDGDAEYVAVSSEEPEGPRDEGEDPQPSPEEPEIINVYTTVVPCGDGDNSSCTGGGQFHPGDVTTLEAFPDESEYPGNHLVCWQRRSSNSISSNLLETRSENPYSLEVHGGDQYWFAIMGTGLKRISVSTNLPAMVGGVQGGYVFIDVEKYYMDPDILKIFDVQRWPNGKIRSCTATNEVGFVIRMFVAFLKPQASGDIGIWYPDYCEERHSGSRIENPIRPVGGIPFWWRYDVQHAEGRMYYYSSHIYPESVYPEMLGNLDFYVHFIRLDGEILRNSSGIVLRNDRAKILHGQS